MKGPLKRLRCWKIPRKIQKVYEFPGDGTGKFSGLGGANTFIAVEDAAHA
jgi:hypothetical protein